MVDDLPDRLSGFIDEVDPSEKTLLLVNRRSPEPLVDLLSRAFDEQPVTVTERQVPEGAEDVVCLVDGGDVEAVTPFSALREPFLMVNVDRYRTGTRQSDRGEFPDVLTGLSGVEFSVRGFPRSNKEKLLLVVVSRFVEHRALTADTGELHSSFQRLSRLDDEYGTRSMYESLAESGVDTHVYGVDDDPGFVRDADLTVHGGTDEEYRRSWFVVFAPEQGADGAEGTEYAALVATQTAPNRYRGMWTYDTDTIRRVRAYVRRSF